ncbi:DnaB-like helicase N-terminal domain-containing protein [Coleofasciculus sp. F4-SAH-05]|uniref:DnaB-like helicase N-terminal domain-containing protein n=1 Tax=Coleofasciculus sp. F4-SAH-05 TaxID=3069525 RepID=UPI0032FDA351
MTESIENLERYPYFSTIPPYIIESEEAVLGGILLDGNAMGRVVQALSPDAFFVSSHREIYRAALALWDDGKPTDFMSVTAYLYDKGNLDDVGGQNKIANLLDRTVSSVNIDLYAEKIIQYKCRRDIVSKANAIAQIAGDLTYPFEDSVELARKSLEKILTFPDKNDKDYALLMSKAEDIILYEDNPGKRQWNLRKLAKQYGMSAKSLEEIYYKHLIHQESEPSMTWDELIAHEQDSQKWVMYGWMPRGSVTVMHGKAGDGKTQFLYHLLNLIGRGLDWRNKEHDTYSVTGKKNRILIVQTDETKPEMIASLKRYGFDAGLNCRFLTTWSVEEMPRLIREIKQFKPDAVLIDSLSSVSQYSAVEESDSKFAIPVLTLRRLAGVFDFWGAIVHHSNKEGGVRGTTAIEAAASTVLKIERITGSPPTSGKRLVSFTKSRSRRPATYLVEADWENGRWEVLEEQGGFPVLGADRSIRQKILDFLHNSPNTRFETKELSERLNHNYDSLRRSAYQLATEGLISKVQSGKRNLYFVVAESSTPETDHPTDPPSNGSVEDRLDDQEPDVLNLRHPSDSDGSTDHVITDFEDLPNLENEKNDDQRIGSAETTQIEHFETDPQNRSSTDPPSNVITKDQLANCRGLSIQQPFATLIPQGLKRYETRGKKTNYRGLVLIHASQKIDKHSFKRIVREQDDPALFPTSRVLAIAKLTDCIFMDESFINEQPDQELAYGLWEPGRYAWKLENIRPLKQTVTGVGALGLWKPNDLLIESLVGVELCDRVDVNNDLYENVPETVNLIQGLLDIERGRPWAMLRNVEGLSKRQRDEILRRLDVAGRGYRIVWDGNNPAWGVIDPALIKRKELIDLRPSSKLLNDVYAFCRGDDGSTEYFDVFDETFHQDDRREIPELPDREKAEARQKAFDEVLTLPRLKARGILHSSSELALPGLRQVA